MLLLVNIVVCLITRYSLL